MSRRYAFFLVVLGAIWGSSYLFIKIGIRGFEPATMMEIRLAVASAVLVGFLALRGELRGLRRAPLGAYALGLVNAAIPFTLIAWGERYVDSGTAAVANSSVPIFVVPLAFLFVPSERSTGLRLVGVLLGLVGVAVLAGVHPQGGWTGAAGIGAIVLASISYAGANLYAGRRMAAGGPVLAATSMSFAFLLLLPLAAATPPAHVPGWKPIGSAIALGLLGTALAQILSYRMIRLWGSARAVLVAYLLPAFALLYGSLFLHEPLTVEKLVGLVLITGGVALGAGAVRFTRRGPLVQT